MLSLFPTFRRPLPLGRYETAASLLARHAAQLGIPGAAAMCADLGVPWSRILSGDARLLADLEKAANVSGKDLARWSPIRTPGGASVGHEILPKKILSQRHTRICPFCLRNDVETFPGRPDLAVFGRAHWHIACLPVCESHGVVLVEPDTGQTGQTRTDFTRWIRPILPDLEMWIRHAVPCPVSDYDAYLFARLRGDARSIPLLGGLPLPMVAQACEVLGRDLFSAQESRPAIDTIPALQAARRKGFSILAAGPSELWNYFDHRLNGAGLVNLSGINLTALYGGLYQWLRRQTDLCLDPLRDLVADHASAKLPLPAGASVCSRILPVRRRHTIRTAAADFHSRPAMMRTWLIAEKVLPASPSRPAETAMIPETPAATAFLETARDAVTHRQASRILKINSDRLDELISGQIVRPIFSTITDPTQNAYARTELTTLLDQIISGSSTRFTSSTPDITYARATKVARQARCTFPDVVRLMITDQTVRAFRNPNEAGIHAIYVSVEDVKNAIHMAPLPGLTPWRFAQTLNITQRDFQQMEGLSLVWTKLVRHPALNGPIAIVPNACIKAFQRRYISLQALAARSRRHWIVERKRLNAYGFEPVYDGPTQRSRFYELSPKLKHLLKQPSL